MNNKFTAIYIESLICGSYRINIAKMKRIERKEGETVTDMMRREGIYGCTEYPFHGHPLMEGEEP